MGKRWINATRPRSGVGAGRAAASAGGSEAARRGDRQRQGSTGASPCTPAGRPARAPLGAARGLRRTGYANASIDEIVSRARVSRTSFYRLFDDKEDCMLAVFEEAIEGLMAAFAGRRRRPRARGSGSGSASGDRRGPRRRPGDAPGRPRRGGRGEPADRAGPRSRPEPVRRAAGRRDAPLRPAGAADPRPRSSWSRWRRWRRSRRRSAPGGRGRADEWEKIVEPLDPLRAAPRRCRPLRGGCRAAAGSGSASSAISADQAKSTAPSPVAVARVVVLAQPLAHDGAGEARRPGGGLAPRSRAAAGRARPARRS